MICLTLFKKKKYVSLNIPQSGVKETSDSNVPVIPDGLWLKCPHCDKTVYRRELGKYRVCPICGAYFRIGCWERLSLTVDEGSFCETDASMKSKNPLNYPNYEAKIEKLRQTTGLNEAVISGICEIDGNRCVICIMDSNFIMGSMGSVVGEKITRAFEYGVEQKLPVVVFTASGGARMQEGIISLMQMAKVSAAVKRHSENGLLYITVLTDPTTGGVTASFAMLGDIIIAEPGALVGFTGRRVIEQTIKQALPDGFQTSDFLLEHGFVDIIVKREDMRNILGKILSIHSKK